LASERIISCWYHFYCYRSTHSVESKCAQSACNGSRWTYLIILWLRDCYSVILCVCLHRQVCTLAKLIIQNFIKRQMEMEQPACFVDTFRYHRCILYLRVSTVQFIIGLMLYAGRSSRSGI